MILTRKEELDIIRRTHQIFCGIKGLDIALISGDPPGKTDCETYISVPIEDPDAKLIHSHEWQHVFFKTDLRARHQFVTKYVENLVNRTADRLNRVELEKFIHLLANALDDLRVSSLWERVYPQSAEDIRNRWRRILAGYRNRSDFISFLMCVALDVPFESSYEPYRELVSRAVGLVHQSGYPSVLLATRVVIDGMLQSLEGTPSSAAPPGPDPDGRMALPKVRRRRTHTPGEEQEQVINRQARALNSLNTSRSVFGFNDTPKPPVGPDPNPQETTRTVQTVLNVTQDHQIRVLLERGRIEVEGVIHAFRDYAGSIAPDDRLLKGLESDVKFRDLPRSLLEPTVLEPQDLRVVKELRKRFAQLINMKSMRKTDAGSTLNPTAYVEFLLGSGDTEFFEDEESSRGFSALILVDMSGSMREKWRAVCRACKVIAQATKFPFSQREVWGFSSSQHRGEVVLFRFEDLEWGYYGPGMRRDEAWGLTPLHLAIPVAVRRLKQMPGSVQHLFIITDGYPTHMGKSRRVMSPSDLIPEVSRQVREARRLGVNVVSLVIGHDVTDQNADAMFGGRNRWTRVRAQQEDLFTEMVGLVNKAFTRYLRTR